VGVIIEFYNGQIVHPKGFTLGYIWEWPDSVLESEHTYIQWLFPLMTTSQYVRSSPTITSDEISVFEASPDLRSRLLKSLLVMLKFYGFSISEAKDKKGMPTIGQGSDFFYKKDKWLSSQNHNMMRISRILSSLSLLGLGEYAIAFHNALLRTNEEYPGNMSKTTIEIWNRIVKPHGR